THIMYTTTAYSYITATTTTNTLSLHDALPIYSVCQPDNNCASLRVTWIPLRQLASRQRKYCPHRDGLRLCIPSPHARFQHQHRALKRDPDRRDHRELFRHSNESEWFQRDRRPQRDLN